MKSLQVVFLAMFATSLLAAEPIEVAPGVMLLGSFQNPDIIESSGVDSSRRLRGAYWTHNDGGSPSLYSFSSNGTSLGEWSIPNLEVRDVEDLACQGGRLYLADIGNNHGNPGDIYLVAEPNPRKSGILRVVKHVELNYPGNPFDAESFFLSRGYGYIIEKESGNAHVHRFKFAGRTAGRLDEQCSLNTDSPVTGADITTDNKRLAVITSVGAYLFPLPRKVPTEGTLEPVLFVPYPLESMEGCTFTPEGLLVTAETGQILLFTDPLFRGR
ncbi:MAG TPA: hypothetical protein VK846_08460 [Candidatus Limnocylindria bacterium]|nr:hypothetical protein [Candidatus Limnocylindria bacterium]